MVRKLGGFLLGLVVALGAVIALVQSAGSVVLCTPNGTLTPILSLCKPQANEQNWAAAINNNWDLLDANIGLWSGTSATTYTASANVAVGLAAVAPYCIDQRCIVIGTSAASPARASLNLVGNAAGNLVAARIFFQNAANGVGADKRIGHIQAAGDGTSSSTLDFYGTNGGVEHRILLAVDVGGFTTFGIGPMVPAEYLHVAVKGHGGIAVTQTTTGGAQGVDITANTDDGSNGGYALSAVSREWIIRLTDNPSNGYFSRWMDNTPAGSATSRINVAKMTGAATGWVGPATITNNASWLGVNIPAAGVAVIEGTAGTHPVIATLAVDGLTITNGAAATTDATTFYISGPPSGITPSGVTSALMINTGTLYQKAGGTLIGAATGGDKGNGTINAATAYYINGTVGLTAVKTVRASGGASDCTLTFTSGLLTATTC